MSLPDAASLEAMSLAELRDRVGALVAEVARLRADNTALQAQGEALQAAAAALKAENQALRDEVARLKGLCRRDRRPRAPRAWRRRPAAAPGRAQAASGHGVGEEPSATVMR